VKGRELSVFKGQTRRIGRNSIHSHHSGGGGAGGGKPGVFPIEKRGANREGAFHPRPLREGPLTPIYEKRRREIRGKKKGHVPWQDQGEAKRRHGYRLTTCKLKVGKK